jgi:hypothetical protein
MSVHALLLGPDNVIDILQSQMVKPGEKGYR